MRSNFKWLTVENPPNHKKLPAWQRSAAINDNGVVFAPAIICDNENKVFLCAGFDGEQCLMNDGHVYFRTSWLKQEFPDTKDIMEQIESKMRGTIDFHLTFC